MVAATLTGAPPGESAAPSNDDAVATIVAATLTASAQGSGNPPPPPSETEAPAPPQPQAGNLPAGVLVQTQQGVLTIYDTQGQAVVTYNLPGVDYPINFNQVAVGGPIGAGQPTPPLFYAVYDNGGVIMAHNGQGAAQWVAAPDIITLVGATAQPVLAYSLFITPSSGYDTRSALYYGTLTNPPTQPVLEQINRDGYAIYPLAVEAVNGQPKRIWYTTQLYGIGDVTYAPRRGLYTYDCDSGAETIVLQPTTAQNEDISPVGISADFQWVAYTIAEGSTLYWQPTSGSQAAQSAAATSPANLGAGDASFSPDGTRIVWTVSNRDEVGGEPQYHSYLQVYDPSSTYSQDPNAQILPAGEMLWMAAWLDNETLLLASWTSPSTIYKLNPVSGLLSGTIPSAQPFLTGGYLTLVYAQP
jgi:hypothetical protein